MQFVLGQACFVAASSSRFSWMGILFFFLLMDTFGAVEDDVSGVYNKKRKTPKKKKNYV